MADFFDVPSFDDDKVGPVFQRAAEAGALADSRRAKPVQAARKAAGAKRSSGDADAAHTGTVKRRRVEGGGAARPQSAAAARGSAPAGRAPAAPPAEDADGLPNGKNLGRRRRLREKRARERLAREQGVVPRAAKPPKSSADAQRIVRKKAAVTEAAPPLSDAERRKQARQAQLKEQRRLQRGLDGDAGGGDAGAVEAALPAARRNASKGVVQPAAGATGKAGKASAMVEAAQARLSGAHFRWLNEQLYTRAGSDALALMRESPELFDAYHEGFRRQTHSWPRHPLDVCVAWLHRCPAWWSVADIGCGDARLGASVPQKVLSFDLVAKHPGVVACDMAHLPLDNSSVQAAVFCLALMSTDYGAALEEAARVLAPAGVLWVAEVRSRFEGDGGGVDAFLAAVQALGFQLRHRDESDTMFAVYRWVKTQDPQPPPKKGRAAAKWPVLKACEYKRR